MLEIIVVNIGFNGTAIYNDFSYRWTTTEGASRYDAVLSVHYLERYWADDDLTMLEDSAFKTLQINLGSIDPLNNDGGDLLTGEMKGEVLYSSLAANLEKNPRNSEKIIIVEKTINIY